jgi:hypothetical protein
MSDITDPYPEHTKMAKHSNRSEAIGDFCMWLAEAHNIDIEDRVGDDLNDILMHYFNIDSEIIGQEKDEMLAELDDYINQQIESIEETDNE